MISRALFKKARSYFFLARVSRRERNLILASGGAGIAPGISIGTTPSKRVLFTGQTTDTFIVHRRDVLFSDKIRFIVDVRSSPLARQFARRSVSVRSGSMESGIARDLQSRSIPVAIIVVDRKSAVETLLSVASAPLRSIAAVRTRFTDG